jgi:hypothetical protein
MEQMEQIQDFGSLKNTIELESWMETNLKMILNLNLTQIKKQWLT